MVANDHVSLASVSLCPYTCFHILHISFQSTSYTMLHIVLAQCSIVVLSSVFLSKLEMWIAHCVALPITKVFHL